jgi:hypothetical protein
MTIDPVNNQTSTPKLHKWTVWGEGSGGGGENKGSFSSADAQMWLPITFTTVITQLYGQ